MLRYVYNPLLGSTEPPFQEYLEEISVLFFEVSGRVCIPHPCVIGGGREGWCQRAEVGFKMAELSLGCVPGCLRNTGTAT